MDNPWFLLFPFGAALGYAISALFIKRSLNEGAGVLRTGFCANLAMGIGSAPFLLAAEGPWLDGNWMAPLPAAVAFFLGQWFTFLALRKGDVSVATPLMGSKVVFVAALSVILLPEPVPVTWWLAAFLTAWSVWLLRVGQASDRKRLMVSIIYALLSAASFAVCDVLVQRQGSVHGFTPFVPLVFILVALFSFSFVPFFNASLRAMPATAWRWLWPGCLILAGQALLMAYSLSNYGSATAVNVVYGLRGILSILLVLWIGSLFGNLESSSGSRVMARRLFSGLLIFFAVILILV